MSIYAKLYGVPRGERQRSIEEVLEAVDLTKWRDAQAKTLSGGCAAELEIARGLVHNPRISSSINPPPDSTRFRASRCGRC